MKKLIYLIIFIIILIRVVSCSRNVLDDAITTKVKIENNIREDEEDYIKRLKEGL